VDGITLDTIRSLHDWLDINNHQSNTAGIRNRNQPIKNQMKYKLIDIEDESSNEWSEPITKKEALDQIQEWNDEMGTNYKTIEAFNENEQYWQWQSV
jgi:hypothetical protein